MSGDRVTEEERARDGNEEREVAKKQMVKESETCLDRVREDEKDK